MAETDVVFPTTKAAIQEALKAVGVDGIRCRNVFLIELDSNLSGFCHCLNQSDSVDELNYLCHLLSDMTDTELATASIVIKGTTISIYNAEGSKLEIFSLTGTRVGIVNIDSNAKTISLSLKKGCYILKVNNVVRKVSIN